MTFPFRLKRRDIHNDAAAGVGTLANANSEDVSRDAEILNTSRERERVGRHDANIPLQIHERLRVEVLWINNGVEDFGEDLELISHAQIVAVARQAVADGALAIVELAGLPFDEWFNHPMLDSQAMDFLVRENTHEFLGMLGKGNDGNRRRNSNRADNDSRW